MIWMEPEWQATRSGRLEALLYEGLALNSDTFHRGAAAMNEKNRDWCRRVLAELRQHARRDDEEDARSRDDLTALPR